MTLKDWVKLPTGWIVQGGLTHFRWDLKKGSDNAAALMSLAVIAHHADDETGLSKLTYGQLCAFTALSRSKIAGGLDVLEKENIIQRNPDRRSTFKISKYDKTKGWGKLPAKALYSNGQIAAFSHFNLRHPAELHALKLYFLIVAFRDNSTNMTSISYDSITKRTGIDKGKIKSGLSVLAVNGLVHIEHVPTSGGYTSNAYRLAHLDSYSHMGTTGRAFDFTAHQKNFAEQLSIAASKGPASSPGK